MDLMSVISSAAGIAAGVLSTVSFMGCCKTRFYTSTNNKIETDALLDAIKKHKDGDRCSIAWSENYWNNAWIPTFLISPRHCFCASTDVTSSSYDLNQQVIEVRVTMLCCLSWDTLPVRRRKDPDACSSVTDEQPLPAELPHVEVTHPSLMWPDWAVNDRLVFPPGTPEAELQQADLIARNVLSQVQDGSSSSSTSAVVVVRGPPRTGKTSAALRLAQLLGPRTMVCKTFKPNLPGHMLVQLDNVRKQQGPDEYLVVLLEEFESWMDGINNDSRDGRKRTDVHSKLLTEVTDKSSWNVWADNISRHKKLIVWMTSNHDDAKIAQYDPALLRRDRITAHYVTVDDRSFVTLHERRAATHPDAPPPVQCMSMSKEAHTHAPPTDTDSAMEDDGDSLETPLLSASQ